jgi:SAM-dependent methyltransferase
MYFTQSELEEFYNRNVKLPASYFSKHETMPPCPIKSYGYDWQNFDFPRNMAILDFQEWVEKHKLKTGATLGYTYKEDPELEFLTYEKNVHVSYPPYDLHKIDAFEETFDFFVFNQTLEHLYNPLLSVENIFKTIKPGGFVYTSVPTLNIPHMTPIHYGGFTPMGLAVMFRSAGFNIKEIGQWGNYDYINMLFKNQFWPGYNTLKSVENGIRNEERNVCQCWILAQKPM